MKNLKYIIGLTFLSIIFFSCKDEFKESFTANSPIYISYDELRTSVKTEAAQALKFPGKIYFKDNYIFINEQMEGIHIINNTDAHNPQNIGFISIPGNVDISIRNNTLYADSYIDLVAIDISDISKPKEIARIKDVLPYTLPSYDENYPLAKIDREKGVVIDWKLKTVENDLEAIDSYPIYADTEKNFATDIPGSSSANNGNSFGVGGSMARFGLYENYLYVTERFELKVFNVKTTDNPLGLGSQHLSGNAETLFIYDDHLFFGTRTGMLIYSLETPSQPKFKSRMAHWYSCDPVVIDEGYAYVTLRGGNVCNSTLNQLDIIKLADNYVANELIASYPMESPYGLGINGNVLFICEGDAGLKVYKTTDKENINKNLVASFPDIHAYDVIPLEKYLFMIGNDGFYQYDYSDLDNITQISKIPVTEE